MRRHYCSGMCKAGFAVFFTLAMSSLPWFAGPDARHHGRYEPEGLLRAHRRQRQLHGQGWFTGYDTPRACSLWSVGRPVMFCMMAGMHQKVCCETALVVGIGSGMYMAGFAGFSPRAEFPSRVCRPRCSASCRYEPEGLLRVLILAVACTRLVLLFFYTLRCVSLFFVAGP